jgi:hypothetical protein
MLEGVVKGRSEEVNVSEALFLDPTSWGRSSNGSSAGVRTPEMSVRV